MMAKTAKPNSSCLFGIDDRDEGEHCIMDDGKYGSFGWCWTSPQKDAWGSCSEACPLFGVFKILGNRIDKLKGDLSTAKQALANATAQRDTPSTTSTAAGSSVENET